MKISHRKSFLGCLMLAIALPTMASEKYFEVNMEILHDGELVSAPGVIVQEWRQADVQFMDSETSTEGGLRMLVIANQDGDVINLQMMLMTMEAGKWISLAEPSIQVKSETKASVSVGRDKPEWTVTAKASEYDRPLVCSPEVIDNQKFANFFSENAQKSGSTCHVPCTIGAGMLWCGGACCDERVSCQAGCCATGQ